MKFIMIANGNRDCTNTIEEFDARSIFVARKYALKKFEEYNESNEVENITVYKISQQFEVNKNGGKLDLSVPENLTRFLADPHHFLYE